MKTTLSLIASLGIVVAGISGVTKADHYHDVVENRVVTYVDNCNNLVTVNEPVTVRYRHYDHISYDVYGRPYSRYVYYPYVQPWRYADSKPRGLFGYRYYRGYHRY
jgi:hypothetical protein